MKKGYKRRTNAAINAYAAEAKQTGEPFETNLTDFLADVLHRFAADPDALMEPDSAGSGDPIEWLSGVMEMSIVHFRAEQNKEW